MSPTTTFTVGGLTNGTPYSFRVAPATRSGNGPWSSGRQVTPRGSRRPRRVAAAVAPATGVGSGQVQLTWIAPADDGGSTITDYVIERSTDGITWTTVDDGVSTATASTVRGLVNGTQYPFRVAARNVVGTGPGAAGPGNARWTPAAPGGLRAAVAPAAGVGSGQVSSPGTPRSTTVGGDHRLHHRIVGRRRDVDDVNDGVSTATTFTVTGLTNGTQYRSGSPPNAAGSGPWSPAVRPRPSGHRPLSSGLSAAVAPAAGVGSGQVKLTWTAPGERRRRSPTTSSNPRPTARRGPRSMTACRRRRRTTVSGLTNGTQYSFRVAATNAVGSRTVEPRVQATPPGTPGRSQRL